MVGAPTTRGILDSDAARREASVDGEQHRLHFRVCCVRFAPREEKAMFIPSVGRWSSEDPIRFKAGDASLTRYVGNNPTNAVDLRGLAEKKFTSGILDTKPINDENRAIKTVGQKLFNETRTLWAMNTWKLTDEEIILLTRAFAPLGGEFVRQGDPNPYHVWIGEILFDRVNRRDVDRLVDSMLLKPGEPMNKQQQDTINMLILQLKSKKFQERQVATARLLKIGRPTEKALLAAFYTKGADLEETRRAKDILETIHREESLVGFLELFAARCPDSDRVIAVLDGTVKSWGKDLLIGSIASRLLSEYRALNPP